MKRRVGVCAALIATVALAACSARSLLHEGDSICIGSSFYVVGQTKSYPWVKLDPNKRCSDKENMPSTYVNFDKVESFQPNCVCRYSAACRKKCNDVACLEACTD